MNLPNKLTIFRVILIPFFIVFLLVPDMPFLPSAEWGEWIALAIFVIASLTDMLDGKIARKYNLITDFGKFMDPLADKLLVCSALIALIELGRIPAWMVIVIIAREFTISGFRLVAADKGKFKTVFQMVAVCLLIVDIPVLHILTQLILWIAVILTIVSLIDYLIKNKDVMKDIK